MIRARKKQVAILGATGSVGASTLDVIGAHPERFAVFALTAHRQIDRLAALCRQHRPRYAVVANAEQQRLLRAMLAETMRKAGFAPDDGTALAVTEVLAGPLALEQVAADRQVDIVMAAIVGVAGLRPSLAAARAGKRLLLANKESLVCAGALFMAACRASAATLLPIDSEHNAIFQCLTPASPAHGTPVLPAGVRRVMLTASGGPFRQMSVQQMASVTPAQACAHPNWEMGRKISVDSATLMNKGLELIEAQYMFNLPPEKLEVVVHPQSIVHSMVEYDDGSVLAQLGNPDMRTPIAHALAYPERISSGVRSLDLTAIGKLEFEAPDDKRFPCLGLAQSAMRAGGAAPCVLNAANEIAVAQFLAEHIRFTEIAQINEQTVSRLGNSPAPAELDAMIALDLEARSLATEYSKGLTR